jgi:hypothetical protein
MTAASSVRVPGHELQAEGAPFRSDPKGANITEGRRRWRLVTTSDPKGVGVCSCGAFSPTGLSGRGRKQWHREHKATVIADTAKAIKNRSEPIPGD